MYQITLSLQRQSSIFLLKSDRPCIENGGTKIDPPPNLKSTMQLKPTSKYNQNQTLGKLQNSCIDLGEPSRSKLFLGKIPMRSSTIMIQHLIYKNTKGVICISFLQSFSLTDPSTIRTPSSSTNQTPPLCLHFRNL